MSITDDLREWASRNLYLKAKFEELTAIADRIDAAHEKAMSRAGQLLDDAEKERDFNYANWQECKQKVLQHNITMSELSAEIERLKDELAHCIELPKDADSEYIHEHDKVDWRDHSGTWHKNALVVAVYSDGCYVMDGIVFHVHASDIRHHKHLAVEDVLVELLCEYDRDDFELTELIERFAAKLRLAGDEE